MTSADVLICHQIKPSIIRVMIYDYLRAHRTHPTVDDIYVELHKNVQTLSKTTVYNTLKLFVERKVAKAVTIDGFQTRYDGFVEDHGHFRCTECNKLFDFDIDKLSEEHLDGFACETKDVYFTGKCKSCNQ